jgi:hypothetical protein
MAVTVRALQELYGDDVGGAMLNALSRLFTARLQATGFTCGMDDLLLTPAAEAQRSQVGLRLCFVLVLPDLRVMQGSVSQGRPWLCCMCPYNDL